MESLRDLLKSDQMLNDNMQRKSAAIIKADALKDLGDRAGAIPLYRQAAILEAQIADYLRNKQLPKPALQALVSSASCWFYADELHASRQVFREALELSAEGPAEIRELCDSFLKKIERHLALSPASPTIPEPHHGVAAEQPS